MALEYQGKITFSDLVPGLAEASDSLAEKINSQLGVVDDAMKGIAWLEKKRQAAVDEANRALIALDAAEDILQDANDILGDARDLVGRLTEALTESGVYYYTYVGYIEDLPTDVAAEGFQAGLPDRRTIPGAGGEAVAATLIILGGDGGVLASTERVAKLFEQIGKNGEYLKDLYSVAAANAPFVPFP